MNNNVLIKTKKLIKKYPMGNNSFTALEDITVSFSQGEFTGIVGPSGSGKTTLLNILGTLDTPTSGSARVLDHHVEHLSHKEAAWLRNRYFGFIFQTYNLLPVYTVYENVEFPLLLLHLPKEERDKMVWQALEWVNLKDKASSRPGQISGGQAQRVAIARAMVKQPKLVIADEPTANLDADNSHSILRMMADLNRRLNTTFIFSTHDEKVIRYLRRIITLEDGRIADDKQVEPEFKSQP